MVKAGLHISTLQYFCQRDEQNIPCELLWKMAKETFKFINLKVSDQAPKICIQIYYSSSLSRWEVIL